VRAPPCAPAARWKLPGECLEASENFQLESTGRLKASRRVWKLPGTLDDSRRAWKLPDTFDFFK
jgi:hypothetical protein